MIGPKRRDKNLDQPWEIEGVSEQTQAMAAQAAAALGAPLEIWLADTVLRATQEGVASEERAFAGTAKASGDIKFPG